MTNKDSTIAWLLAATATATIIYLAGRTFFDPPPSSNSTSESEPPADAPSHEFSGPTPSPAPARPNERSPETTAPGSPAPTADLQDTLLDPSRPSCERTEDCTGPRTAACVDAVCTNGKCVYDYTRCECTSARDCEDNDPCTRNHCFARTQKCIFIPLDDCP